MRIIQVAFAIAVLGCITVCADSMDAQGSASGTVVLYFSGTSASGTFDSSFALVGTLTLDDVAVGFSTMGWARGSGSGDTATLDLDAQATFAATGSTDDGDRISVQGGLTLAGLSAGASGSSGSGTGDFFATVFIADRTYRVQGKAEGSASGGFVIPEDPYSMELEGDGTFNLSGDMTLLSQTSVANDASSDDGGSPTSDEAESASEESAADTPVEEENGETPEETDTSLLLEGLPWDISTWPEELVTELLEILTTIVEIPTAAEETPASN